MTKKLLGRWLAEQKSAAIAHVHEARKEKLDAFHESVYRDTDLAGLAEKVQALLSEADQLVTAWHEKNEELVGPVSGYYNSLHSKLYGYINSQKATLETMKEYEVSKNSAKEQELYAYFRKLEAQVKETYDNVILNVSRLKDAKSGMEYLKSLGFDLADLIAQDTAPVETALAVPIDTRFLCLQNRES